MASLEPNGVAKLINTLEGDPLTLAEVCRQPAAGGAPNAAGFYVWWTMTGTLPVAEGVSHLHKAELSAFYAGISPVRPGTKQRLRGRIVGNHIGGNTGASTFRFALAALLQQERGYRPRVRIDSQGRRKYILPRAQNTDLRNWQEEHLRLTWAVFDKPWQEGLENAVISHFKPPLNSADNSKHPFHDMLSKARATFRETAEPDPT